MYQFYYKENKFKGKTPIYTPNEDIQFTKDTWDASKYIETDEKLDDVVAKLKDSLSFTGMDMTSYCTPYALAYHYFLKTIRGKFELYIPTDAQTNFILKANYKYPCVRPSGTYDNDYYVQIDVNALFWVVMRERSYPCDVPIWDSGELECFKLREKLNKSSRNTTYHFVECDVEVNEECRLHLLPNENGRWNYKGNITKGVYTSLDLHLAVKYGGYKITKVHRFLKFLKSGKVFKEAVEAMRLAKIETEKKHGKKYAKVIKKMYTGLYGKTLQVRKVKTKKAKDVRDVSDFIKKHDKVTLGETSISATTLCNAPVYLGCFIQAFARQHMFKYYDMLDVFRKAPTRCFYSKVDSLLITRADYEKHFKHKVSDDYGGFKIEVDNIKRVIVVKENSYCMEKDDGTVVTKGTMKTLGEFQSAVRTV